MPQLDDPNSPTPPPAVPLPHRGALTTWRRVRSSLLLIVFGALLSAVTPLPRDKDDSNAMELTLRQRAASAAATTPAPSATAPASIEVLQALITQVDALLAGSLSPKVDPRTLFDIEVSEPEAVTAEVRRLGHLLPASAPTSAPSSTFRPSSAAPPSVPAHPTATVSAHPTQQLQPDATSRLAGAVPTAPTEPRSPVDALFAVRIQLDLARLRFYQMPESRRQELLKRHKERQSKVAPLTAAQAIQAVDREAEEAELARKQALAAAQLAHTEAERAVHEELARLLEISAKLAAAERSLLQDKESQRSGQDEVLGHRRRTTNLLKDKKNGKTESAAIDAAYLELTGQLNNVRRELAGAIKALGSSDLPDYDLGEDSLGQMPEGIDRSAVDSQRAELTARLDDFRRKAQALTTERARLLMNEADQLNRIRLELVPHLSNKRRDEITGFTSAGFRQARAEAWHVWLTLSYRLQATQAWIAKLRSGESEHSGWMLLLLAMGVLIPTGALLLWRRKATAVIAGWLLTLEDRYSRILGTSGSPPPELRALRFFSQVRRPLEWLVLIATTVYLLPASVRGIIEVELLLTVCLWTLGGSLIVASINALNTDLGPLGRPRPSPSANESLRLGSLRLVGRTVVTFGLILSLSSELVGEGTVYSWVLSTCWLAGFLLTLLLVAWWRPTIFTRMDRIRKKNVFERWVLSSQQGATSFAAAMAGGVYLFATGADRLLRNWVVTFTVVRRVLAYSFRRGMSKAAAEAGETEYLPLPEDVFARLGPDAVSSKIVPSVADKQLDEIVARIRSHSGGVFVIVGERGSGKSTLLTRMSEAHAHLTRVVCPVDGLDALRQQLTEAVQLPGQTPLQEIASHLDQLASGSALLVDDAHHLLQPCMGGLREFDELLGLAREHAEGCTWVFAMDQALWRFLERARGRKPLFDDVIQLSPWSEEGITRLLQQRSETAGLCPSFEPLIEQLPDDADEVDKAEAIARIQTAYFRLMWDYAGGNPGVALHFWRLSLGQDEHSASYVKPFEAPNPGALEQLPDSAAFVLLATVQLGWATPAQLVACTCQKETEVRDALRYGTTKGYFEFHNGRYTVTWNWYRSITRFLTRRHLLYSA